MKARVKATGYIVDVELSHYIGDVAWYITKCHASYSENELEFIDAPEDYWTRLEHTYVGMFMKSFLDNFDGTATMEQLSDDAIALAHALVEKLKEKEERK